MTTDKKNKGYIFKMISEEPGTIFKYYFVSKHLENNKTLIKNNLKNPRQNYKQPYKFILEHGGIKNFKFQRIHEIFYNTPQEKQIIFNMFLDEHGYNNIYLDENKATPPDAKPSEDIQETEDGEISTDEDEDIKGDIQDYNIISDNMKLSNQVEEQKNTIANLINKLGEVENLKIIQEQKQKAARRDYSNLLKDII